jgi:dihydropteroate synthase
MEPATGIFSKQTGIRSGNRYLLTEKPLVMGILNVTPDSFYDGGMYQTREMIGIRASRMLEEGADILDIGACSTRPGSKQPDEAEEWKRLSVALEFIRDEFPEAVLSVDTFRAGIAARSVEEFGAEMINDVSGGNADPDMFATVGRLNVPYVLMHMQGTPSSMQQDPRYGDVVEDISLFFAERIRELNRMGVSDIILDPGFGFGKDLDHNYELMARLADFRIFERPLMVGISRKSMISKVLAGAAESSLNGTTVLNAAALLSNADILRVHDVRQARECITLTERIKSAKNELYL